MTHYVFEAALDGWAAKNAPILTYPDGQKIRVGDCVTFGVQPADLGIDPSEGPWTGRVLAIRWPPGDVVVDTYLNSHSAFEPSRLRLVAREERA